MLALHDRALSFLRNKFALMQSNSRKHTLVSRLYQTKLSRFILRHILNRTVRGRIAYKLYNIYI
jgi:hypothetical protein